MTNISMRVDLSDFFSDVRRNTLIFIDASWENINNVQDHIQKLFRLSNISLLTHDGCYLSPKESILVLSSVESLKAIVNIKEDFQDATAETNKKRKNRSVETEAELSSSTPNNAKRSKSQHNILQADTTSDKRLSRKSAKKHSMPETKVDDYEAEELEDLNVSEICTNNKTTATMQNSSQTQRETTINNVIKSFNFKNHTVCNNEDEDADAESGNKTKPDVEFHSSLIDKGESTVRKFKLPTKPQPVKILENIVIPAPVKTAQIVQEPLEAQVANDNVATEAETPVSAKKPAADNKIYEVEEETEEFENNSTSKVAEQSLLETDSEDDDVMVLDDTNLDDSNDNSADIIADMLRNAQPLTALPNVGETIIFKLTKMKGALKTNSPRTEYISASCSYINRRTKAMSLTVIACGNATKQALYQYRTSLDDSTDTVLALSVNFKDLIEPKVIVSSVDLD